MIRHVKGKSSFWRALLLMAVFALTRWPGLMPLNFSAAYGLAFCAGVYFSGRMAWWLPLATLGATDILLNIYYSVKFDMNAFQVYQLVNYVAFAAIIWLGKRFKPEAPFLGLLGGGVFGALLFYFLTNTAAWFFNPFHNPEYTKTLTGWIIALTRGTSGYPETWEFFRNTLLSGGLFTGLFAGAMKLTEAAEPAEEEEKEAQPEESEPEKAEA